MTAAPARPTCFLHMGPPKTGSSTISHFIEGNIEELERRGYFVPRMPSLKGRPQNGHGIFANVALNELEVDGQLKPNATLWTELEEVAATGEKHIVLTNEAFAFSLRDPAKVDAILTFFERHGYPVTVVAYLRDQPSSLNSSYVQTQKRLYARQSFDEFVEEAAERGRVDPWRLLEHIIDNPRVTLSVGSFEKAMRSGLEADFSRRIGLPDDAGLKIVPEVRNPNAGIKTVYAAQEIMRQTSGVIQKMPSYKKIYRRFRKHFETLGWTDDAYVGLDQQRYAQIREFYRDSNERFSERFLGADWAELAPDRAYSRNVFDPATASQEELDEIKAVVDEIVTLIRRAQRAESKGGRLKFFKKVKKKAAKLGRRKKKKGSGAAAADASRVA